MFLLMFAKVSVCGPCSNGISKLTPRQLSWDRTRQEKGTERFKNLWDAIDFFLEILVNINGEPRAANPVLGISKFRLQCNFLVRWSPAGCSHFHQTVSPGHNHRQAKVSRLTPLLAQISRPRTSSQPERYVLYSYGAIIVAQP